MKLSKKIGLLLLSIVLTVVFTGSIAAYAKVPEPAGGWSINKDAKTTLTKRQLKVFNKAVEKLDGVGYRPIAVVGTQVVAGVNYAFLCQKAVVVPDAIPTWVVMTVYEDTKGKVKMTGVKDFVPGKVKTTTSKKKSLPATGAWENYAPKKSGLTKADSKVFSKAAKAYKSKVKLSPITLLESQVVNGVNFRFLAYSKTKNGYDLYVVTVYQNAAGKCKIKNCKLLNLKKYVS